MVSFFYLNEPLSLIIIITLLIIMVLIPTKKKVLEGKAGWTMTSKAVPIVLGSSFILLIIIFFLSIFLVEDDVEKWVLILTCGFSIPAVIATGILYFSMKKFIEGQHQAAMTGAEAHIKVHEGAHTVHAVEVAEVGHGQEHAEEHVAGSMGGAAGAGSITVECPGCGGRLEVHEGASSITCPHCGLTGSL